MSSVGGTLIPRATLCIQISELDPPNPRPCHVRTHPLNETLNLTSVEGALTGSVCTLTALAIATLWTSDAGIPLLVVHYAVLAPPLVFCTHKIDFESNFVISIG